MKEQNVGFGTIMITSIEFNFCFGCSLNQELLLKKDSFVGQKYNGCRHSKALQNLRILSNDRQLRCN